VRSALHDPDVEPVTNYTQEVASFAGAYRHAVGAAGALVSGLGERLVVHDAKGTAAIDPRVALWERLLGEYRSTLLGASRLGLEERAQSLAEAEAEAEAGRYAAALKWFVGQIGRRWDDDVEVQGALKVMFDCLDRGEPPPS